MHCIVLVPDLLAGAAAFPAESRRRFACLELLAARGRRTLRDWPGLERHLLEYFGVERQASWPSAPFALLGEGATPGADYWCHGEPVHLRADRDRLLAAGAPALALDAGEAERLAASINHHFGDGLRMHVAGARRWYARLAAPPAGEAQPLRGASGQVLQAELAPIGWHALMNEIQMLLHEHPVNLAREARGELPVNGVWLWGGGRLAACGAAPVRSVTARSPLALGLARHAGLAAALPPAGAERWLASAGAQGRHLLVLDALALGAQGEAPCAGEELLERLEREWIGPLLAALRRGRVGMLTLHLAGERLLESEASGIDLRRLWRRRRPLDSYRLQARGI